VSIGMLIESITRVSKCTSERYRRKEREDVKRGKETILRDLDQ
jgi:hypothetical protein